jgi:tetratricopeptide (TPR) repeat protein
MPDILLQDYIARIRGMIREVRLEEAIGHARHILKHYPKHMETYCLLGEACLEKEMYRDAIESFQRALSADPENLIARVGLGVIYEEQGAMPEAIWQLERAFELAPGNAEVRQELQRLYVRHGAGEQARLKLTRGALGRLYNRNGLYERAVGEFQAVLRQDPDLPDVRVALAEALWRDGRRLEAVEVCLEILEELPNCLKANLILGEIWTQGGNEEAGEEKLKVARALDPENRVAQDLMGRESPLPLEEVFVPELEAVSDRFEPLGPSGVGLAVLSEQLEGEVSEAFDEEMSFAATAEAEGLEEDLPDWLRDMGVTAEVEPALELESDGLALDAEAEGAFPTEEMPEWLQEFVGEESPPDRGEERAGEVETAKAPDWLDELESEEVREDTALPEVDVPAGAAGLGAGLAAGVMVSAGIMHEEDRDTDEFEELSVPVSDEVPEWLQELVDLEEPVGVEQFASLPAVDVDLEGIPAESEVPASLQALVDAGLLDAADLDSAIAGMSTEDLEAQRTEDVPVWLQDLIETPEGEAIAPPVVEMPVEEVLPARDVVLPVVGVPEGEELAVEEVELPIVEALVEEVPPVAEVELPVIEAPVAEIPPIEEVELPVIEAPVAEIPPIEEVELPVIEAPVAETPPIEEVELPIIETPVAEIPPIEEVELPVIEALAEVVPPIEEVELPVVEAPVAGILPIEEVELPVIEALVEEALPIEDVSLLAVEAPVKEPVAIEEILMPAVEEPVEVVVEGASRVAELESQLRARPRDYGSRLELARLRRDGQDWNAALAQYEKLVSARKLLTDVRGDLEAMAEEDVDRARLYQLLGDIDMQQDKLDSALEMYRLARHSLTKRQN